MDTDELEKEFYSWHESTEYNSSRDAIASLLGLALVDISKKLDTLTKEIHKQRVEMTTARMQSRHPGRRFVADQPDQTEQKER